MLSLSHSSMLSRPPSSQLRFQTDLEAGVTKALLAQQYLKSQAAPAPGKPSGFLQKPDYPHNSIAQVITFFMLTDHITFKQFPFVREAI